MIEESPAPPPSPAGPRLAAWAALALCAALFAGVVWINRTALFDDAFISYRFARNVVEGHGLRFNPADAPVEGYTNFLFVMYLVPFLWMGFDPLAVSQVTSVAAAAVLSVLCGAWARRLGASGPGSIALASLALVVGNTGLLCMTGLETVVYALALAASMYSATGYALGGRKRGLVAFGLCSLGALLLRPEAVLYVAIVGALLVIGARGPERRRVLRTLAATLALPLAAYVIWKQSYFGAVLPAPFFVKVGTGRIVSTLGLESVTFYVRETAPLIILALASLFLARGARRLVVALSLGLAILYGLFFLHVETLMDVGGRFLYPVTPLLLIAALPAIDAIFGAGKRGPFGAVEGALHGLLGFATVAMLAAAAGAFGDARQPVGWLSDPRVQIHKYRAVALKLAAFPSIRETKIWWGDAGVIPYYTGAHVIDDVGLTDARIARERDPARLLDYILGQRPDLIWVASRFDSTSWFTGGHGLLGNTESWIHDGRLDAYSHVGTISGDYYDVEVLLRRDSPRGAALAEFLVAERVVDRVSPFGLTFGSGAAGRAP